MQHRRVSGKSRVTANVEQRAALSVLATSRDRGEADRARAVLLTLSGWTSPRIAEAFGVREDTVRLWRGDFVRGGVDALKARTAPGPEPVKSAVALRVVTPLLEEPVADTTNWTIARLRAEIEAREGVRISRSGLAQDWGYWRQKAIPRVCSLTPEWPCELDFEVGENRRRGRGAGHGRHGD
jgi:transposase